ncbi:MAG: ComF family protein [Patescibacteria group bacterium]
MFYFLIKAKNILLDIFFPPFCLHCQKYLNVSGNKFLCGDCFGAIKLNSAPFCPVCRKRLAENKICRHGRQRFSYLLLAAGSYDDPVLKNLIHYYKYKNFKNLTPLLGKILLNYLKLLNLKLLNFIIVPIPLYPNKERKRGFNQAKLLAEFVGQKLNIELAAALKKIKNIKPQAQIKNGEERIKNIEGCFEITNPELVKNKNIILMDDVFTSGATMNEAVKILKEAGAKRIIALVLAKA